ncbi:MULTISPECIES: enoyl-CoA hydratase/isomerase family protein [Sporosarcina]|uniref:Enoyl-CoA hydratase n=1 Tax=Sporosarcina ureae TaxID=1571 RepID=A0ABM6JVN9_SPOUR|nr:MULTISPECIES: enoyl-CoA hydratase-related protein [Sporosarcina]ARF14181.1 enoyl-CoA hydratase [Sporosarcina ureae]PIC76678.1 enoyl-CoA hydratase [Sporosarcina sp. P19]
MTAYKFIETSVDQQIGVIELNRPKQLNSLNRNMVGEILEAMQSFDRNDEVRVILLVGKGKAFSAGADIDEMAEADSMSLELLNQFADWDQIPLIKKPVIGAVHGFVFGGGFELALCCDVLLAADGTEFSFPEVTLGVMPGAGGTQRLTKLVGRAKAIEWLWTGERIQANELQKHGVINRIVSPELLREEALRFSNKIASMPPLAIRMIKDSVNKAVDYPLYEGMQYERKNFYLLFSSEDQKEGMKAFVEKRKPVYKGK